MEKGKGRKKEHIEVRDGKARRTGKKNIGQKTTTEEEKTSLRVKKPDMLTSQKHVCALKNGPVSVVSSVPVRQCPMLVLRMQLCTAA
jgi:hypothetical protein